MQRIQNSELARTVTETRRSEHITPVLARLHWLPIQYRIRFKLVVITYKVLTTQEPSYLAELIRLRVAPRDLRSVNKNILQDCRSKLKFADRAFLHAAPTIWNSLPSNITSNLSSISVFKRSLKTELYSRAFRY